LTRQGGFLIRAKSNIFKHGIEKISKVRALSSNIEIVLLSLPISSNKRHHSKDHGKRAHTNSNHTKQECSFLLFALWVFYHFFSSLTPPILI
jgi:hypothetical protein